MAVKSIRIFALFVLLFPSTTFAYNDSVHHLVARDGVALSRVELYLEEYLGLRSADTFTSDEFPTTTNQNSILTRYSAATGNFASLILEGAIREDRPVYRGGNHFYDPTTGGRLTDGGGASYALSSALERVIGTGSNVDWKNAIGQVTGPYKLSWVNARDYFYKALTLTSNIDKNKNWGNLFLSMGSVVHLLTDMAVPAHVRNDSHGPGDNKELFEKWCDYNTITTVGYNAVDLHNIADYWDTNTDKGLSEFTNANFFSRDTNVDNIEHVPTYSKPIVLLEDQGSQEEIRNNSGQVIEIVNVRYGYGIVYDAYSNMTYQDVPLTAYSLWDFETKQRNSERVYSLNVTV
jgi:hypothetical protein